MVMMGFLNKFMNAIGVELEGAVADEVTTTIGPDWSPGKAGFDLDPSSTPKAPPVADGLRTKLRLVPMLPKALLLDKKWQKGVPTKWPVAGQFLRERTGHDFPILSRLRHARAVQSIMTMLRENLDPSTSQIGLRSKVLAGLIFAEVVEDPALALDIRALAERNGIIETEMEEAVRFAAAANSPWSGDDASLGALMWLARAASNSPTQIDAEVVTMVREDGLCAAAVVELICWVSVLQMLHRLTCFYSLEGAP